MGDEQRVAAGEGADLRRLGRGEVCEAADLVGVQPPEDDPLHRRQSLQVGEEGAQVVVQVRRIVAGGGDEKERLAGPSAQQVPQRVPCRRGRPVQVLHHDQQAARSAALAINQRTIASSTTSRSTGLLRTGSVTPNDLAEVDREPGERVDIVTGPAPGGLAAEVRGLGGDQVDERPVRAVDVLEARPEKHPVAFRVDHRGELGDEPALAHARLPGHHHGDDMAGPGLLPGGAAGMPAREARPT